MNELALVGGVAATVVAASCALADGALLAPPAEDEERLPTESVERSHRALATGRILAHLGAGIAIASLSGVAEGAGRASILAMLALALVEVSLVEGAARAAGHALGDVARRRMAPFVRAVETTLWPMTALARRVEAALQRALPPQEDPEQVREESAERFLQVVAAEAESTSGEEAIMHGVFALGETEVREVMVPRVDMVAIEHESPWAEVLARVRSAGRARLPVYAETSDEVIGILYAKDLLPVVIDGREPEHGWQRLVREATFIPTTKKLDAQLRDFQTSGTHIAIVIDEFGGTSGLVTIEDILEEIVGEIRDENDDEEPPVEQEEQRRYWVSGRVNVDQLCELLGIELETEGVTTVGGLVYHLFGRVPRAGEALERDGFRIIVERVRRRRIERVYFERLDSASLGAEG